MMSLPQYMHLLRIHELKIARLMEPNRPSATTMAGNLISFIKSVNVLNRRKEVL